MGRSLSAFVEGSHAHRVCFRIRGRAMYEPCTLVTTNRLTSSLGESPWFYQGHLPSRNYFRFCLHEQIYVKTNKQYMVDSSTSSSKLIDTVRRAPSYFFSFDGRRTRFSWRFRLPLLGKSCRNESQAHFRLPFFKIRCTCSTSVPKYVTHPYP
jgi:hypothetical protein